MAVAAEQITYYIPEEVDSYSRERNNTETWAAEVLNGSMRTSFEYDYIGGELYSADGESLRTIFDDAIEAAQVIVEHNPGLLFELRRRIIESSELDDMENMAKGYLPNTMVVLSDYPPELMDSSNDVGGYNAKRKQTMMRVITRQPDGSIRTVTQSLDGSNRQALESICESLGYKAEPGELLGQRIHFDMPEQSQNSLCTDLTAVYDTSLSDQWGGEWHSGFRQPDKRSQSDTYAFVRQQTDLINWFTNAKISDSKAAEKLRFKFAATIHQRYENYIKNQAISVADSPNVYLGGAAVSHFVNMQAEIHLFNEINDATKTATQNKQVFNGCGSSVGPELSGEATLQEAGYGNKTTSETSYKFDKKMHCVSCQPNAKPKEAKKNCGPCGLCRSCDRKAGGKG